MSLFSTIRYTAFPTLEQYFPRVKFVTNLRDEEFVGVVRSHPDNTEWVLSQHTKVYENNLAAVKSVTVDGREVYETASYAYRPKRKYGEWQYHIRLWPHVDGTAITEHKEYNPLSRPWSHYHPTYGETWLPPTQYDARSHEYFDIDTDAPIDGIGR